MKKIIGIFVLLAFTAFSFAQGDYEAFRFTQTEISGTARFSNVDENANGGIMVTLDKTDGLRTVAVARSENARSAVD